MVRLLFVSLFYIGGETLDSIGPDESHTAATKTCPSHPSTEASGVFPGELRDEVELSTRDFVQITKAFVRGVHEATRPLQISALERLRHVGRA